VASLDVFYWDACIFYEHCRGDQPDPHRAQAISDLLEENRDRRNRICTSVITHTEVVPKKLGANAEQAYWDCFGSTYFFDIDVSRPAILLSREIRDFYFRPQDDPLGYRLMSTGDAIHLATAIIEGVTEFHTRDARRKGGNVPLIGLNAISPGGQICGKYDLKIIDPIAQQLRLV
jgi:hypothetical protein